MISRSIIKYIQSLQQKKFRDEYGAFVAEGPKVVNELLDTENFVCRNIYALEEWAGSHKHDIRIKDKITVIDSPDLVKLSGLKTPNQVVAEFEKRKDRDVTSSFNLKKKISLVLDDIRDPGNMGTIIRTADWFGIENIFCSPETVDMYNPKVVQSTMASLGRVNIVYTDIAELIRNSDVKSYGAVLNGTDIQSTRKLTEGLVIIGNESNGINDRVLRNVTHRLSIPGSGNAESLNAAVATGIILYALTNGTE